MNTPSKTPPNGLSPFEFQSHPLRVFEFQSHPLRVIVGEHGEPWFVAVDVCAILGYDNPSGYDNLSKAIKDHCKEKGLTTRYIPVLSNRFRLIDEENLYLLLTHFDKPEAEAETFAAWVCNEVLPSIRLPAESFQIKPVVTLHDGKAVTTSQAVAEYFGKLHKDVLEKIRALIAELPPEFYERNFPLIQIDTDLGLGRTRQDPAYELTRDAFTLLAMGFTGKAALAFKLAYIEAFNRMEMELLDTRRPLPQDPAPVLPPPAKESSVTRLLVTMREGQAPITEKLTPNKHVLSLNDFTELARKTGFLVISKDELIRRFFGGEG